MPARVTATLGTLRGQVEVPNVALTGGAWLGKVPNVSLTGAVEVLAEVPRSVVAA